MDPLLGYAVCCRLKWVCLAPSLIIFGTFDPLFSLKQGYRVKELIPEADIKIVACGGHNPQIDHGDEVAKLICQFLDRQS